MEQFENPHKHKVHHVLAHSYSVYFILFLIGFFLDLVYKVSLFADSTMLPLGVSILVLATGLIFWAQKTGRDFKKVAEVKMEHFCRGPYCYTRIPTQFGLFFLMLGFGIITNSFFVSLLAVVAFIIAKFVFIGKQEKMLEQKYGVHYTEYKKAVKF